MYKLFFKIIFLICCISSSAISQKLNVPFSVRYFSRAAAFSPDGTKLITSGDHMSHIWDLNSGVIVGTLREPDRSYGPWSVAFSFDGRKIITVNDQSVSVWDFETETILFSLRLSVSSVDFSSASFHPFEQVIMTSSRDGFLQFWSALTGRLISSRKIEIAGPLESASFSSDGKKIITAGGKKSVKVYDYFSEQKLFSLDSFEDVEYACFNPDGTTFLIQGNSECSVFESKSGKLIYKLKISENVNSVEFSSDGKKILTGHWCGIRVWDAQTGSQIKFIDFKNNCGGSRVSFAKFCKNGIDVISGETVDDNLFCTTKIWNIESGQLVKQLTTARQFVNPSLGFSNDGSSFLYTTGDNLVGIWDGVNERYITCDLISVLGYNLGSFQGNDRLVQYTEPALSHDARFCAVVTNSYDVVLLESNSDSTLGLYFRDFFGMNVYGLQFSIDASKLAILTTERDSRYPVISIIDLGNKSVLKSIKIPRFVHPGRIKISSDFKTVLLARNDFLAVFDVESENIVYSVNLEHKISNIKFSPDNKYFIAFGEKSLTLLQLKSYEILFNKKFDFDAVDASISSDNSSIVVAFPSHSSKVLDISTGSFNEDFKECFGALRVQFSNSDKWVVAVTDFGVINAFDSKSGKLIFSFSSPGKSDFVFVDDSCRFDGTSHAIDSLYFICNKKPFFNDDLKSKLWTPGLFHNILYNIKSAFVKRENVTFCD